MRGERPLARASHPLVDVAVVVAVDRVCAPCGHRPHAVASNDAARERAGQRSIRVAGGVADVCVGRDPQPRTASCLLGVAADLCRGFPVGELAVGHALVACDGASHYGRVTELPSVTGLRVTQNGRARKLDSKDHKVDAPVFTHSRVTDLSEVGEVARDSRRGRSGRANASYGRRVRP